MTTTAMKVLFLNFVLTIVFASPTPFSGPQAHAIASRGDYDDKGHDTIYVQSGQRIQDAIDRASSSTRIIVEKGTYAEQLVIKKSGIDLIGHDAQIVPPAVPVTNECSGLAGNGTQAGICVLGSGIELADFVAEHQRVLSVQRPVKDVSISGFHVSDFVGENIVVYGAKDTRITGNTLTNGAVYGFLTAGSYNTIVTGNTVTGPATLGFISLCMDNFAGAHISKNDLSGSYIALCVQTSGADIHDNHVENACIGAYVDPGIEGAELYRNFIGETNPLCSQLPDVNARVAFGIVVDGAIDSKIKDNRIVKQTNNGNGVGIAVIQLTGGLPTDNKVIENTLYQNDLDIFYSGNGTGNVFERNRCSSSSPEDICS